MSAPNPYPDGRARDEAARWLSKLARGLDRDDGPAIREWLKDPAHRKAMVDSVARWHGPDVAALIKELMPEEAKQIRKRRRRNILVTAAASLAAVGFVVTFTNALLDGRPVWSYFDGSHLPRSVVRAKTYETGAGEKRAIEMPDGSTITLDSGTKLSIEYSMPYRDVSLERGQAHFSVLHDPDWPFNIRAGKRAFTSMGGRFDMQVVTTETVDLTVKDGWVKVQFATPKRPDETQRGQNLSFGEAVIGALHTARVYPGFQSIRKLETR